MSDDDGIQAWAPIEVVEGLLKRAEQAEAAIARVLEWHAERCDECNDTGPCQTIRAIDGAE